jgi:hypothetical protein
MKGIKKVAIHGATAFRKLYGRLRNLKIIPLPCNQIVIF